MKMRVGLLVLITSTGWASDFGGLAGEEVPLSACANAISQKNNNPTGSSTTLTSVTFSKYAFPSCAASLGQTVTYSGAAINLNSGNSSFNWCMNYSAGTLGTDLCGGSPASIQMTAASGAFAGATNGDCINITCSGGRVATWARAGAASSITFS